MGWKGVEISMKGYCDNCRKEIDEVDFCNYQNEVICETCLENKKTDTLVDLINYLKAIDYAIISRGHVIDKLSDKRADWVYILKSLLIKETTRYILVEYLLEKCISIINDPLGFLDWQGLAIFRSLKIRR